MNILDIIILVCLLIGAYSGFKKGLLQELVSLSAFFIAIIVGLKLLDTGVNFVSDLVEGYDRILPFVVFIIIFLVIVLLLNLLGKAVKQILDLTLLGSIDDLAGAALGVFKWGIVISILFWIFGSLGISLPDDIQQDSYLYDPVTTIAPALFNFVSGVFPFIQEFFQKSQEFVKDQDFTV